MRRSQAMQLRVGDVVMWDRKPLDRGRVAEVKSTGFRVEWDNGANGWIHFFDVEMVSLAPATEPLPFTDPPDPGEDADGEEGDDGAP